jgi:hypothetical protein
VAKGSDGPSTNPKEPGWYPDPWSATGEGERYFDGKHWGTTERPMGRHTVVAKEPVGDEPSRLRRLVVPVVVLVVLVGAYLTVSRMTDSSSDDGDQAAQQGSGRVDGPPAGREEASKPLGTPGPVPAGDGAFEFIDVQPSNQRKPVAWDPCRPIHYVVNPAGEPADGQQLIADAVARLSEATGLRFIADGPTSEVPGKRRDPYQPKRYGNRWAPVAIAWTDEAAEPELAGYIAGVTSPHAVVAPDGTVVYISGEILLDREQLKDGGREAESTVLHELGHLAGLDHVSDRTQIMFSEGRPDVTDYADGDLRGLAALGRGACAPDV